MPPGIDVPTAPTVAQAEVVRQTPTTPAKPRPVLGGLGELRDKVVAKLQSLRTGDSRKALHELSQTVIPTAQAEVQSTVTANSKQNAPSSEQTHTPEQADFEGLRQQEQTYLEKNRYDDSQNPPRGYKGLDDRYASEHTGAQYVLEQMKEHANTLDIPPLADDVILFPPETPQAEIPSYLKNLAREQVKKAFHVDSIPTPEELKALRQEGKKLPPEVEKALSVLTMSDRYIDLAMQAKSEGELQNFTPLDLARLVRENILKLSYQDYIAAENSLGDHGVRHLVDHNITVTEQIAAQLPKGQKPTAADRLMMHQIMIDHDLGYAMDPVRDKINGTRSPDNPTGKQDIAADRGHNVLAAKFMRERALLSDDPLARIFTPEQIGIMHEGILTHDSSSIALRIEKSADPQEIERARRENIMSMIHLADNTHAFETKLPEVLFSAPESLKTLLLMKIATESGLGDEVAGLKADLIAQIQAHEDWSAEYRKSLSQAVETLTEKSYLFTVPRICGNDPEFRVDSEGKVTIQVQESSAHHDVMRLFGQQELQQLVKFVSDVSKKPLDPKADRIETDHLNIILKTGEQKSAGETAYQAALTELFHTEPFQSFIDAYEGLANERAKRQNEGDSTQAVAQINTQVRELLQRYMAAEKAMRNSGGANAN